MAHRRIKKVVALKEVVFVEQKVIDLLELMLQDARKGKIHHMVIGHDFKGTMAVSYAGKPSLLVGHAARALHFMNQRADVHSDVTESGRDDD